MTLRWPLLAAFLAAFLWTLWYLDRAMPRPRRATVLRSAAKAVDAIQRTHRQPKTFDDLRDLGLLPPVWVEPYDGEAIGV